MTGTAISMGQSNRFVHNLTTCTDYSDGTHPIKLGYLVNLEKIEKPARRLTYPMLECGSVSPA